MSLLIRLPANRDYTGTIEVLDGEHRCLAGPFPICGRAGDELAAEHGNASRTTTLPFGDTPLGNYRVVKIVPTGAETRYRRELFGAHGAVVLSAKDGDAALADANGRFEILIHGGPLSADGRLRATSGHLRMRDEDLLEVFPHVSTGGACACVAANRSGAGPTVANECLEEPAAYEPVPKLSVPRKPRTLISSDIVAQGEYSPDPDPNPVPQPQPGPAPEPEPAPQPQPQPEPEPEGDDHYEVKDDSVILSEAAKEKADEIADAFHEATGEDIVVTDGSRTPENQAERMYDNLSTGGNLSIYADKAAAAEIEAAYDAAMADAKSKDEAVAEMATVIERQIAGGVYISNHLREQAFDVRITEMTQQQQDAFRTAAQNAGAKVLTEGHPPHFHVQF